VIPMMRRSLLRRFCSFCSSEGMAFINR
jgi:hypothetical protein